MGYFKRENIEQVETKIVGVVFPTSLVQFMNLYCLVDKRSKSAIIRPMVEEWIKQVEEEYSEKKLIKKAAEIGYAAWKNRRGKSKRTFLLALKFQEKELRKKGLEESVIEKIINRITEINDSTKSKVKE